MIVKSSLSHAEKFRETPRHIPGGSAVRMRQICVPVDQEWPSEAVGDEEVITLHEHAQFRAVAPDDNSQVVLE